MPTAKAWAYAHLAVDLLQLLLDVDLSPHLTRPFELERQRVEEMAKDEEYQRTSGVYQNCCKRRKLVDVTIEALEITSCLVLPSFRRKLESLEDEIQAKHLNPSVCPNSPGFPSSMADLPMNRNRCSLHRPPSQHGFGQMVVP